MRGKFSEEHKRKISESVKKTMSTKEWKESEGKERIKRMKLNNPMYNKISIIKRIKTCKKNGIFKGENNPFYGKKHTKETINSISEKAKERFKDKNNHPMYGRKCEWITKRNLDINFQKKARKGLKKPTKPERIMREIIERNTLPFNYMGNGKIWFTWKNMNFNPDFLSKNPKHIIEVYGDYWHNLPKNKERDIKRLKTYSKYGFRTLVIWEHELIKDSRYGVLLSEQEIVNKIKNFMEVR